MDQVVLAWLWLQLFELPFHLVLVVPLLLTLEAI